MTHSFRSLASFRGPSTPRDFRHHAVLHDADPRLFDAVVRHLRQRLYAGRVDASAGTQNEVRAACMRQGTPPWFAAFLLLTGAVALFLMSPQPVGAMTWFASGALLVGVSLAARAQRKHLWVVAHPYEDTGTIDLWMAGVDARGSAAFASEFARLVDEIAGLQATLNAATPGDRLQNA